MNIQHAARASKPFVPATEIHRPDPVLPEHGCTHDAWLNGHIQVGLFEDGDRVFLEDAGESNELGVSGPVQRAVCFVATAADDGAVFYEDAAYWCLVAGEGVLGLVGSELVEVWDEFLMVLNREAAIMSANELDAPLQ
jgi:hypothetical protein